MTLFLTRLMDTRDRDEYREKSVVMERYNLPGQFTGSQLIGIQVLAHIHVPPSIE